MYHRLKLVITLYPSCVFRNARCERLSLFVFVRLTLSLVQHIPKINGSYVRSYENEMVVRITHLDEVCEDTLGGDDRRASLSLSKSSSLSRDFICCANTHSGRNDVGEKSKNNESKIRRDVTSECF